MLAAAIRDKAVDHAIQPAIGAKPLLTKQMVSEKRQQYQRQQFPKTEPNPARIFPYASQARRWTEQHHSTRQWVAVSVI